MLSRLGRWLDGELRAEDQVTLFPAVAWPEGGGWKCSVGGTVFQPALRPLLSHLFRRALGFDGLELSSDELKLFRDRSAPFLADRQPGRLLHLRIGERRLRFEPSAPNGHFTGTFAVNLVDLTGEDRWPERRCFDMTVRIGTQTVERELPLSVHLLGGVGVDVITDVDDTIKVTNVRDKKDAARNTFLRPFQSVPGIATRIAAWAEAHHCQIHYLTGSPWQLYGPLSEFARAHGFPTGHWAMQGFRLKDRTALRLLKTPEVHKMATIKSLMHRAPERQFVCVGDSGERDPEIYGAMARQFPGRICRIFIRDVTGESLSSARYQTAFAELPAGVGQVFQEARELPGSLQ